MNRQSLQQRTKTVFMNAARLVIFITLTMTGSATVWAVQDNNDWQVQRLLHPTASQRAHEKQGQVFIYDGLSEKVINRAMEQGFDRIDSMMFVNVKKDKARAKTDAATPSSDSDTDTDGSDDDGCD